MGEQPRQARRCDWALTRVSDSASASSPIQSAIKTLQDPKKTTFRFDGLDLMPGVVGAGSF
jgi:hypothetical protein